ncbi:hypothetical protein [Salinicola salarius]
MLELNQPLQRRLLRHWAASLTLGFQGSQTSTMVLTFPSANSAAFADIEQ